MIYIVMSPTSRGLSSASFMVSRETGSWVYLGSVSSRECLDVPVILVTFKAGRTGLVIV